jgi:hypothetical protein
VNHSAHKGRILVADEVLEYLCSHENAHDTVEGIVAWWLPEQRIRYAVSEVEAALDELVECGFVIAQATPDRRIHYQMNPKMKDVIRRHLYANCIGQTLENQVATETSRNN